MKAKPKVLFINLLTLPLDDIMAIFGVKSARTQSVAMPLGILYLSAAIKAADCVDKVGIVDYVLGMQDSGKYGNIDAFIEGVARENARFEPDVLAFSLNFSASYAFFLRVSKVLRQLWPCAVTIVGGVHATNSTKYLLEEAQLDYVARGEGERSMAEFLKALADNRPINIKGIYSRNMVVAPGENVLSDCVEDLDELPFPDWDLIDMNRYAVSLGRQRDIDKTLRHASLMTTRGCFFRCTFCSAHTVHGRKIRLRSVENVLKEMRSLYGQYGVTLFMPEDDLFTANKSRVLELLAAIKNSDIPGLEIQFPAALSVNTLDESLVDALMDAGMRILVLAVESGSSFVQKNIIKKNCDLNKARRLAEYAKSKGLLVRCYFIGGFPSETKEQINETIEYAKSLQVDWCVFNIATPLVGSEMYKQFVKMGCIKDCPTTWESTVFDKRQFDTPEITAEELNSLIYRANLECNFLHNPNIVRKEYDKAILLFQDIVKKHSFHVVAWYCMRLCHCELKAHHEAARIEKVIKKLVSTDSRAADMLLKYRDLMPDLPKDLL